MPPSVKPAVLLAGLLFFLFLPAGVPAQESLTIGWAEFDTSSLDQDMSRLGVIIPKALMTATGFIQDRFVPQDEMAAARLRILNAEIEKGRAAVASARRKRDLISITTTDPAERAAELRSAQLVLDTAISDLEAIFVNQDAEVDNISSQTLGLGLWTGHEDGSLLPPVETPSQFCTENKLDLLVYGKVESLGQYLVVELAFYNKTSDEESFRAVEYTAFDDLDGLVASLERPLATALAGRPFGRLMLTVSPENAEVELDGEPLQNRTQLFYAQSSHVVTVTAAGYKTASSRIAVVPGNDTTVNITLERLPVAPVLIHSNPAGAALYLDGVLQGSAPLQLPGAAFPRVLTARLDGFDDLRMIVRTDKEPGELLVNLNVSDGLTFEDRFERAKGGFYQSLGWFILSLPVTVLSYGTFNTYQSLSPFASTVSARTENLLKVYYYGSLSVFWISAALSVSLATNSLVQLVHYIKAAR